MHWYPWYPVDYRRDTLRLSLAEDGAYRRLIDEYMILRGPLPDDDRALARLLGVSLEEWMAVANTVRNYFTSGAGLLHHKRCDQEIAAQIRRVQRFSERGRKGAFGKYSKINHINASRMLVPATIHNKERKRLGREENGRDFSTSPELEALMRGVNGRARIQGSSEAD